ncbi:MAG: InlB B-repeat-containing protein, partial [Clostridiales bacterium]|nr:InlB B-repeat-containing protein [Clostridiales bacterium]
YAIVSGGSGTNAGGYNAVVELVDTANYEWADGTDAGFMLAWTVTRAVLSLPALSESSFTHTGGEIDITGRLTGFNASLMEIVSGGRGIEVGAYTLVIRLASANHVWAGGHTGNAELVWMITPVTATYEIRFIDGDGNVIHTQQVLHGESPSEPAQTPTKTSTAQYEYVFVGWDKELGKVIGEEIYIAQFRSVLRTYTVTFLDFNGKILNKQTVAYGSAATPPAAPKKHCTWLYKYTFSNWDESFDNITEETTLTAVYAKKAIWWIWILIGMIAAGIVVFIRRSLNKRRVNTESP